MVTPTLPELALLAGAGVGAGWLGALIGIGGGVLLVPTLVIGFGLDMRLAVATSLVTVIATSTAAGSVYVGSGQANMRLGMSLEIATTIGGVVGGLTSAMMQPSVLAAVFAAVVWLSALLMMRDAVRAGAGHGAVKERAGTAHVQGWEERGRLAGAYDDPARGGLVHYEAERLWLGMIVSVIAGAMSGLLGVGGGFLKVPAMTLGMKVPIKVAAATSNFMIGVTAASSVFVYYGRGDVHALLAAPVALGVIVGATFGTRHARRASHARLAQIMALVLAAVAIEMALKAFGVGLGD